MQGNIPLNIRIMLDACRKAEKVIMRELWSDDPIKCFFKGSEESVYTETDLRVENILKAELSHAKPGCGFICEESGRENGNHFLFIIDPIDGTTNFTHRLPFFAISIALAHVFDDGSIEVIAGIIYAPVLREIYWACKGRGAFMESGNRSAVRLRTSNRRGLAKSLISMTPNCFKNAESWSNALIHCNKRQVRLRNFGSASISMAYVAAGKLDAFMCGKLGIWDVAAGVLIIKEAGGTATDVRGRQDCLEVGDVVTSNGRIHDDCLAILEL